MHVVTDIAGRLVVERRRRRHPSVEFVQLFEYAVEQLIEQPEWLFVEQFVVEHEQRVQLVVRHLIHVVIQFVVNRKLGQFIVQQFIEWRVIEFVVALVVQQFEFVVASPGQRLRIRASDRLDSPCFAR